MNQETAVHCSAIESPFRVESLPFSSIPQQTKLFLQYQENPVWLAEFYPSGTDSHTGIQNFIPRVLENYQTDRRLLCDALEETNRQSGAGEKTFENINLLRETDCVAVVTGQQAGLFSGALYTIYKALSAVKLAECLRGRGFKAVPVFWIAEEDHDFDEVRKTFVINREGSLTELENTPRSYAENLPVGAVKLDHSITDTIDGLFKSLPQTEFSGELEKLLKESYHEGETFSTGFAKFLAGLFSKYGLIIFSPLNQTFKKLSAPVFAEALRNSNSIRERLLERTKKLEEAGFHAQVLVEEDFFPFFWIDETGRRQSVKFQVESRESRVESERFKSKSGREFDLQELLEIAEKTPENLSPNALMRPVVQDYLLPTVCYFGGAAEIAYFAQNSVIYETLNRPVTPVLHRQSLSVVEAKHGRTLRKYDLDLTDLFGGTGEILSRVVEKYLNPETAKIFAEAEDVINAQLNRLEQNLSAIEPTLAENLTTRRRKILYHIGALQTKFHNAQMRRDLLIKRQIESVFNALLPHKALQERTLTVATFLNAHGFYLIDWVYQAMDLDDKGHRIIYL